MLRAGPDFELMAADCADELRRKIGALDASLWVGSAERALGLVHDTKGTASRYGCSELSALAAASPNAFVESRLDAAWAACRMLRARAAAQGAPERPTIRRSRAR